MNFAAAQRRAVGRTVIVVAVVVILILAVVAGVYYFASHTSTSSSTTSGTSSTSGASSSSTSSSGGTVNTLTIDDETWPAGDLNQLNSFAVIPYPDWLSYTVYQSLVTLNGSELYQNGNIALEPMLAASWNESASGDTWTFFLQKGVTFSNGDPFNAYQVWGEMYGEYYLSGNTSGWAVGYNVFNMNTAGFGPSTLALMASTKTQMISPTAQMMAVMTNSSWPIYVINQYEIGFNLAAAFPYFPQMWVQSTGLMYDTQYVLNNGGFGTPVALNTNFNDAPIPGTGPYTVTNVVPTSSVSFTQNSNYWAKNWTSAQIQANPYMDPGHVKNVVITVQLDDVSRYVDLTTGAADMAPILQTDWSSIINNPKFTYFVMPSNAANIVGLALNVLRYPTNITDFRQAIVHAINYTAISDEAFLGLQGGGLTPMMGPEYPSFTQLYDLGNIPPYQYNVTLAEQDINASGVNMAALQSNPLEFRVIEGCGTCLTTAQLVQLDLAAVNIPVNIIVTAPSQYAPPYIGGDGSYAVGVNESQTIAQIAWFGTATFAPDQPTPADSLLTWVSNETSANNWAIYSNPVVQTCVNDLTNGTPQAQLITACTAAQAQVANDAPYVWLGSVKLFFGGGSIVWNNQVVKSFLADPVFSGQSSAAIFNTVKFANGQDQ
ncbi:MAG: ABC transporter substrate-binding protein [Nitrososphaerales archaeon]|jgi:ABC-type transport system substrate-binding protein